MDVFVSCVARALPLCRVVQSKSMFSTKGLHLEWRRRRWWHQIPNLCGEETRRSVVYQVKQAKWKLCYGRQTRLDDGNDMCGCQYHATLSRRNSRVGDNAFLRGEDDTGRTKPSTKRPWDKG